MPPDRVSVYRQLQLGATLKPTEDGYQLDLSLPGQHKTASVFGPAITTVTDGVASAITALVHLDSLTTTVAQPIAPHPLIRLSGACSCLCATRGFSSHTTVHWFTCYGDR